MQELEMLNEDSLLKEISPLELDGLLDSKLTTLKLILPSLWLLVVTLTGNQEPSTLMEVPQPPLKTCLSEDLSLELDIFNHKSKEHALLQDVWTAISMLLNHAILVSKVLWPVLLTMFKPPTNGLLSMLFALPLQPLNITSLSLELNLLHPPHGHSLVAMPLLNGSST